MTPLHRLLLERIARDGPMTFRDVMAAALYHPEHGYYTRGLPWKGAGDFTTAPRYGPTFGLAVMGLLRMVRAEMPPGAFEVVEVGSGSGELAAQLWPLLREEGMRLRTVDHRRPPKLPQQVPWTASMEGFRIRGAILSNELFDALPVHRVTMTGEGLREEWVVARGETLAIELHPPSRPELAAYLDRFGWRLAEGQTVEVSLDALTMMRRLGGALEQGIVLTVDYGHDARELLQHGPDGTLAAMRSHRQEPDALARLGEQDLTAHVNFTALEEEGRAAGLDMVANVPQRNLLAATGALRGLAAKLQGAEGLQEALAAKTLLAPGSLGDFRVLVQAKGLAPVSRARLARRLEHVEDLDTEAF